MLIECSHSTLAGPMEMSKSFAGQAQTTARMDTWRGFATPHAEDSRHFHSTYSRLRALAAVWWMHRSGRQTGRPARARMDPIRWLFWFRFGGFLCCVFVLAVGSVWLRC